MGLDTFYGSTNEDTAGVNPLTTIESSTPDMESAHVKDLTAKEKAKVKIATEKSREIAEIKIVDSDVPSYHLSSTQKKKLKNQEPIHKLSFGQTMLLVEDKKALRFGNSTAQLWNSVFETARNPNASDGPGGKKAQDSRGRSEAAQNRCRKSTTRTAA